MKREAEDELRRPGGAPKGRVPSVPRSRSPFQGTWAPLIASPAPAQLPDYSPLPGSVHPQFLVPAAPLALRRSWRPPPSPCGGRCALFPHGVEDFFFRGGGCSWNVVSRTGAEWGEA